jgi:HD-GYP domain-containing protein (c-di-GMP phosphodiesterase class II)
MLNSTVNQHYLDKVMDLAEEMPVIATDDIFDARGNKLLAKGAKVSRNLQEKLILHKLTKPIEASLCVSGGVDARMLVKTAERLIAENAALAALVEVSQGKGPSPLALLAPLQFGNAITMMLTIVERGGKAALDHAVTVAVASACLAKAMKLTPEQQQTCTLAGLLHDIGELYVDPAFLAPDRRLLPHEWAHLVVHPKTGQMLIDELENCSKEVGRAVAESHERLDGTGYPRRLSAPSLSQCGQVVAAAEAISALLHDDHPLERAELALKLMTREHDRCFLAAVSQAKQHLRASKREPYETTETICRVELYGRVVAAIGIADALCDKGQLSPAMREAVSNAGSRLRTIQRAAISSGLDMELLPEGTEGFDGLVVFEHKVATREINWRLRDLARDFAMTPCTAMEVSALAPLLLQLDPPPEPAAETIAA